MSLPDILDKAKELAEFLALVSAAVFFLYKAYTGYFRVNLSLSLACQRRPNNGKADDTLVLSLRMKKGVNGSLTLHDVAARVSDGQSTTRIIHFVGIARSGMRLPEGPNGRATIDWSQPAKSPFLKLIPDEEVELSAVCTVPADSVCTIEVGVLGQKTNGHPFGQWKASCVSVPEAPA